MYLRLRNIHLTLTRTPVPAFLSGTVACRSFKLQVFVCLRSAGSGSDSPVGVLLGEFAKHCTVLSLGLIKERSLAFSGAFSLWLLQSDTMGWSCVCLYRFQGNQKTRQLASIALYNSSLQKKKKKKLKNNNPQPWLPVSPAAPLG